MVVMVHSWSNIYRIAVGIWWRTRHYVRRRAVVDVEIHRRIICSQVARDGNGVVWQNAICGIWQTQVDLSTTDIELRVGRCFVRLVKSENLGADKIVSIR